MAQGPATQILTVIRFRIRNYGFWIVIRICGCCFESVIVRQIAVEFFVKVYTVPTLTFVENAKRKI